MEFKRGTGVTHYFKLPIVDYVVGAFLYFTAKEVVDNDNIDALAVINKQFTDADVDIITDPLYATYTLKFDPIDFLGLTFPDGASVNNYLGEFKYVVAGTDPVAFPSANDYIQVKIYANIRVENP